MDFRTFHREVLPARLAGGHDALAAAAAQGLPSLGIRLSDTGDSITYRPGPDGVALIEGDSQAELQILLGEREWRGLAGDLETAPGLLYSGRVQALRGDLMQFVRWEPALRAMYHGRPLYDPAQVRLASDGGEPFSADQRFSPADSDSRIKAFLDAAGYVVVGPLFDAEELAAMRAAARALHAAAVEGDQQSWWGKDAAGKRVLTRVLLAGLHPTFATLYDDPRIRRLAALMPELQASDPAEKDSVTLIYKNSDMVEGLSDLPWHRDCGMGGHAVMCPTVVLSIYLYDATEAAGALHFLPGSQHASVGFIPADAAAGVVAPARAGDVSLHYSDVMHAAPPPRSSEGPFRESVLLTFKPVYQHHLGERHYNDPLLVRDDGQVEHLDALVRRRSAESGDKPPG
ncbi:MAG: phytanoyl-CoA dioxygenase family protein [Spongiibacteraceae bacterium]|jgi:ectoine hydroxylase-related dioxygenase (phytanoyl-CoA dioxygenase family)|nr:phytanoyl-CoA dioxygenase family protein [Spongiibacteraceae bacterium]